MSPGSLRDRFVGVHHERDGHKPGHITRRRVPKRNEHPCPGHWSKLKSHLESTVESEKRLAASELICAIRHATNPYRSSSRRRFIDPGYLRTTRTVENTRQQRGLDRRPEEPALHVDGDGDGRSRHGRRDAGVRRRKSFVRRRRCEPPNEGSPRHEENETDGRNYRSQGQKPALSESVGFVELPVLP